MWRVTDRLKSLPLPDDPDLAGWASALNDAGHWADIYDAGWRDVFVTDELRLSFGDTGAGTVLPIGFHIWSAEATRFRMSVIRSRYVLPEFRRALLLRQLVLTFLRVRRAAEKSSVGTSIPSSPTWSTNLNPKIFPRCGLPPTRPVRLED